MCLKKGEKKNWSEAGCNLLRFTKTSQNLCLNLSLGAHPHSKSSYSFSELFFDTLPSVSSWFIWVPPLLKDPLQRSILLEMEDMYKKKKLGLKLHF